MRPRLDRLDLDVLGDAFLLDAAVVRHLLADPVLPAELAPAGWPDRELRATFEAFDAGFKATWRAWFQAFRDG